MHGWDVFNFSCAERDEVYCKVCHEKMRVTRNTYGKMSMFGSPRTHDLFTCKDSDEKWHKQVLALRLEIEKTPSKRISDLLYQDVAEIMGSKEATKEFPGII